MVRDECENFQEGEQKAAGADHDSETAPPSRKARLEPSLATGEVTRGSISVVNKSYPTDQRLRVARRGHCSVNGPTDPLFRLDDVAEGAPIGVPLMVRRWVS
jgi:hypothetical protein